MVRRIPLTLQETKGKEVGMNGGMEPSMQKLKHDTSLCNNVSCLNHYFFSLEG